ncbi:hypothetical protein GQX73_g9467 [Xylaria multiplex]|uniref:Uncharacterized protein n=1 Tax=Xylaria multiplex TaxID=323545 RepID=A0A7C8MMX8_9PEZI|nr:hypothetical protein GQX73_g9467 [Xylaria multiplex]
MAYEKVQETEEAEPDHDVTDGFLHDDTRRSSTQRPGRRLLWALIFENILFIIVLLLLWGLFVPPRTNLSYQSLTADKKVYPSGPLSWSQSFEALPCGKTPEEARARGCEFDMLVTAWLPPRCIDRELVDEFMAVGQWEFYTKLHAKEEDKFGTYDPDFIGSVNHTVWTTRRWHATHCLFMFKKLTRALVRGWTTDAEAVSEPHMEHCMKVFLDQVLFGPNLDQTEIETYLEIIYPPC